MNRSNNVVPIRASLSICAAGRRDPSAHAFDNLTVALVMERHARGELEPALLVALLQGVGLDINEAVQ